MITVFNRSKMIVKFSSISFAYFFMNIFLCQIISNFIFRVLIKLSSKNKKKKQTYFDKTRLEHDDLSQWVADVKNNDQPHKAYIDVKSVTGQME